MVFGYARISTESQKLDSQIDKMLLFGIPKENIYSDCDSGAKDDRKELEKLLGKLRRGDTVVFYDLTRLGRSIKYLITLIEHFHEQGINFKDLTNPHINTESSQTAEGELIFLIFALIAQFMRKSSNEKVKAGLAAAKRRGKTGGRPTGITKRLKDKASLAVIMHKDPGTSITDIMKALGISSASVYKCFKHEGYDYTESHKGKGNNNRNINSKIVTK